MKIFVDDLFKMMDCLHEEVNKGNLWLIYNMNDIGWSPDRLRFARTKAEALEVTGILTANQACLVEPVYNSVAANALLSERSQSPASMVLNLAEIYQAQTRLLNWQNLNRVENQLQQVVGTVDETLRGMLDFHIQMGTAAFKLRSEYLLGSDIVSMEASIKTDINDRYDLKKYSVSFFNPELIEMSEKIVNGVDVPNLLHQMSQVRRTDGQLHAQILVAAYSKEDLFLPKDLLNVAKDIGNLAGDNSNADLIVRLLAKTWGATEHLPVSPFNGRIEALVSKNTKAFTVKFESAAPLSLLDLQRLVNGETISKNVKGQNDKIDVRSFVLKQNSAGVEFYVQETSKDGPVNEADLSNQQENGIWNPRRQR